MLFRSLLVSDGAGDGDAADADPGQAAVKKYVPPDAAAPAKE